MRNIEVSKMVSAVILVNTDLDAQDNVLANLKLVDGVEEAHALYGVYDFFVKINASSIRFDQRFAVIIPCLSITTISSMSMASKRAPPLLFFLRRTLIS